MVHGSISFTFKHKWSWFQMVLGNIVVFAEIWFWPGDKITTITLSQLGVCWIGKLNMLHNSSHRWWQYWVLSMWYCISIKWVVFEKSICGTCIRHWSECVMNTLGHMYYVKMKIHVIIGWKSGWLKFYYGCNVIVVWKLDFWSSLRISQTHLFQSVKQMPSKCSLAVILMYYNYCSKMWFIR